MEALLQKMEEMKISCRSPAGNLLKKCTDAFVPEFYNSYGLPCQEKDFQKYQHSIDKNLKEIEDLFLEIFTNSAINDAVAARLIVVHLIIIVGEQSEKSPWNTSESPEIARNILHNICRLLGVQDLSSVLDIDDKFETILMILRPKLLKNTWKHYPGAVNCYRWLLNQVKPLEITRYLSSILPTALIIFDDYIPENRIIGLQCLHKIIQHSSTQDKFIKSGYADVIYDALEKLTHQRDIRFIVPTVTCITYILTTFETAHTLNTFEWKKRDNILEIILNNMEMEQDHDLRHAYMTCLPALLTDLGCAKWLQRLVRIIEEYCSHHTDLRTLKATLQTAEVILNLFHHRIPAHCTVLYRVFLRLHLDLSETPIFDTEIINSLERCVCKLYQLTPTVGSTIMRNDRMRTIIRENLLVACIDTKYCN